LGVRLRRKSGIAVTASGRLPKSCAGLSTDRTKAFVFCERAQLHIDFCLRTNEFANALMLVMPLTWSCDRRMTGVDSYASSSMAAVDICGRDVGAGPADIRAKRALQQWC
jgi:hypothetical protein